MREVLRRAVENNDPYPGPHNLGTKWQARDDSICRTPRAAQLAPSCRLKGAMTKPSRCIDRHWRVAAASVGERCQSIVGSLRHGLPETRGEDSEFHGLGN